MKRLQFSIATIILISVFTTALLLINNTNQAQAQTASNSTYTNASDIAKREISDAFTNAVENNYEKITAIYINMTDSDGNPVLIYNKTAANQPKPPAANQPPILDVKTPVSCDINKICEMSILKAEDPEGNTTSILWQQQDKNPAMLLDNNNSTNVSFNATIAGEFMFNVSATDNFGAMTSKLITSNVKAAQAPIEPTPAVFDLIFTGDVKGTSVFNAVKKENADMHVTNGDLGYGDNLNWYKSTYGTLPNDRCTQGNHDAKEDGSSEIAAETLAYCGAHWYTKIADGKAIVIGFTTNGNYETEAAYVNKVLADNTIMDTVKVVFLSSHKNGNVPPNSHHGAEAKTLYELIKVPAGVERVEVNAHNHYQAKAPTKGWYIEGAGGKSHYDCDTSTVWVMCNNSDYGYLKFEINTADGAYKANFYDTSGRILTR